MSRIIQVEDRPPIIEMLPLSLQHLFAMFGASVLVPIIFGIDPGIVLLMNGIGTLVFILITKGKAPAFLGSSFAYIPPALIIINHESMGFAYALGGFIVSGFVFCFVAFIIKYIGTKWIDILLPAAAMGPVVAVIGLELAPVAIQTAGLYSSEIGINFKVAIVFFVTLATGIFGAVLFRGFAGACSILIAFFAGYLLCLVLGILDLSSLHEKAIFSIPQFQLPKFNLQAIIIILPATLVCISEHIGHQIVTSRIVGRELLEKPGLHRTMFGDGFSTVISGLAGSVPTTTYGENIGVMAITKVYSTWVIGGAAIFSIILAFIGKVSGAIQSIPGAVMGGVCFLLYGMIAASGIRLIVDAKVDYSKSKNLVLSSVVFTTGISGLHIHLGNVELKGMALAACVAVVLSLVFYLFEKRNTSI